MADDALARLFVKNLIGLNQLENASSARVLALIKAGFNEVNGTLVNDFDTLTKFQKARQLALFKRTGSILSDTYGSVAKIHKGDLFDISQLESRFTEKVLTTSTDAFAVEINTTRLTAEQLNKIVELPIQGFTRSQWWESQAAGMSTQVRRQIQLGLFQGEPMGAIAARVKNVSGRAANEAKAIVRTAVTSVTNESQYATFKAQGDDVTSEYEFVVTLDEDTCPICGELDGEQYAYDDETAPRPPQHINCRCTIVAVVNWEAMGVNPKKVPGLDKVERAAAGEPTKYKSYEQWLKKQSLETQQEVLGMTKGTLFNDGDISLADLVKRDQSVITTADLAKQLGLEDKALGQKATLLMQQNAGLVLPGETKPLTFPKGITGDAAKDAVTETVLKDFETTALFDKLAKPKLSDEELNALSNYQGHGYGPVNKLMRTGTLKKPAVFGEEQGTITFDKDYERELKQRIDDLNSSIAKSKPLPEAVQVYRAVGGHDFTGLEKFNTNDTVFKKLQSMVGKTFTDEAFVSTTTDREFANRWGPVYDHVLFEIKLPKGTKGLWVPQVSDRFPEEAEYLLKGGSQFKVISVDRIENFRTIVRLELVP